VPGGAAVSGKRGFATLLLVAGAVIVAFDAVAAWAALTFRFPYAYALVGSCLLYGTAGFIAARAFGFGRALLLGAWLGLVDASLGWMVSWEIGVSRVAALDLHRWLMTALLVGTVALVCAATGAGIGVLSRGREPR
jgi:hypothetical protein